MQGKNLKNRKFDQNQHFTWSEQEEDLNNKFFELKERDIEQLPQDFFEKDTIKHLSVMKSTKTFQFLDQIPKGTLHHIHFVCNEDMEFLKNIVFDYPGVYITKAVDCWKYGTQKQACAEGWLTVKQVRQNYASQEQFQRAILKITQFLPEQIAYYSYQRFTWKEFQIRIQNFLSVLYQEDIFEAYLDYICRKYIKNGYNRVQFRQFLPPLAKAIDQSGEIKFTNQERFPEIAEKVQKNIQKQYPAFSLGLIINGLKCLDIQKLEVFFRKVYNLQTQIIVGIDMVQEEDLYPHFELYEPMFRKLREEFKDVRTIPGVFHAGETRDMKNSNIQKVVQFGTKRIGHGTNLFQHAYLIEEIQKQNICIQVCPLSNQFLGYVYDLTQHPAISYYHMGIPISINSDDPSKFGYSCNTPDYFIASVAFGFDLKDLKLIGIYSIEHSLCTEEQKNKQMKQYLADWQIWLNKVDL